MRSWLGDSDRGRLDMTREQMRSWLGDYLKKDRRQETAEDLF
uniref:Uncharacterized protein n=1 Tax=Setaria viridis TaxID=4556 RepID=A0A4V6D9E1_SETVI|nr:hypothetical protein SEVIR_3G125350v2 [Setaria viridis]